MTDQEAAKALLAALTADKWYTRGQAIGHLTGAGFNASAVLLQAESNGWLCHEPGTGSIAYDAWTWPKGGLPRVPGPVLVAATA